MTVVCKVVKCPYRSSNGFCRNRVLCVTQNGLCGHVYNNNGQPKLNWMQPIDQIFMDGYKPTEEEILAYTE